MAIGRALLLLGQELMELMIRILWQRHSGGGVEPGCGGDEEVPLTTMFEVQS